jgi:fumarate reductase flavoprotein subunit
VVIGGGAAGMTAAVKAAEGGASVAVFEKARHTGGAANMTKGSFAVGTRLQRRNQVPLTRDQVFKLLMDHTHWSVDARLVRAYVDKSGSTIDWLEQMGVEFCDPYAFQQEGQIVWHTIVGGGSKMIKTITDRAKELGVNIFLQTPAKKVIKKGDKITGVAAEDKSGESIQANAKAVIIGTGGFGDNPDWIKKYFGYEWGHSLFSHRIRGLSGDGIRMAWEIGAAETTIDMPWSLGLPTPFFGPFGAPGGSALDFGLFHLPHLMVNLSGERFVNEETIKNWPLAGNAIRKQKNQCAFMIFDEDEKRNYDLRGNLDINIKQAQEKEFKHVFIVDSLEKLCVETGIDPNGLRKTVDEYNKACEIGYDEIFNKNPQYLKPIKKPKYYAGRFFLSGTFGTLGGIKINYKTEVLANDFSIIPGFYAAGNDANAIYGGTYPLFLAGNILGFALSSGYIAGENAIEYIRRTNK